jgi:hypothetical protein
MDIGGSKEAAEVRQKQVQMYKALLMARPSTPRG